ncbi:MAG: NAD-dependent epimerase/dehydratase family protein, partial [Pirellulales bacterium]|nr:NAD-dependent epimerase/dehydratase family protein [Pirellulales bacterium]
MRIVVTGATGLVGTQLVAALEQSGSQVIRAVRRP